MNKLLTGIIIFIFPSVFTRVLLNLLGHKISKNVKFGLSIVLIEKIEMLENTKIGHFNLIQIDYMQLAKNAYIGNRNKMRGPFRLSLDERGAIGNNNIINRASKGITYGESQLVIGKLSKLTTNHFVDCTRSIIIGDFTTFAGRESHLWTHGYVHDSEGEGRHRVDGEISIGNNVYIGSRCTFNAGIKIANGVTIGSNSVISKNLLKKGLYVNQGLRYIEKKERIAESLEEINDPSLIEKVYQKNINA